MSLEKVGTRTEWDDSSESISSTPGMFVGEDMGPGHESFIFHVSNNKLDGWGDGGVWGKNDWSEPAGIGFMSMEGPLGNGNAVSNSGKQSVDNEVEPSLASAESAPPSHIDPLNDLPEEFQRGVELGNPSFWMGEADPKLEMSIDTVDLNMIELLPDFQTILEVPEPSRHLSLPRSITLDSEFPQSLRLQLDTVPQPLANSTRWRPRAPRSQRAPARNRPLRPTYQFQCSMNGCTRSYKRRYELLRHQKVHSGVRNHACRFSMCDRGGANGFARKDHLHQHLRQVHGVSS